MYYDKQTSRRLFLKFLAGSPLLGYFNLSGCSRGTEELISHPYEAIDVFEFEPVAREKLFPAHYGFLASGVEDETTLRANREGFLRIHLRGRRLIDVGRINTATQLFGMEISNPILLAPAGSQRAFHADGEIATAKAAELPNCALTGIEL